MRVFPLLLLALAAACSGSVATTTSGDSTATTGASVTTSATSTTGAGGCGGFGIPDLSNTSPAVMACGQAPIPEPDGGTDPANMNDAGTAQNPVTTVGAGGGSATTATSGGGAGGSPSPGSGGCDGCGGAKTAACCAVYPCGPGVSFHKHDSPDGLGGSGEACVCHLCG